MFDLAHNYSCKDLPDLISKLISDGFFLTDPTVILCCTYY